MFIIYNTLKAYFTCFMGQSRFLGLVRIIFCRKHKCSDNFKPTLIYNLNFDTYLNNMTWSLQVFKMPWFIAKRSLVIIREEISIWELLLIEPQLGQLLADSKAHQTNISATQLVEYIITQPPSIEQRRIIYQDISANHNLQNYISCVNVCKKCLINFQIHFTTYNFYK